LAGTEPGKIDEGHEVVRAHATERVAIAPQGELDRRWAEFERVGESYTQDEVEAWLKTWGTRDFRPFRSRQ
jgi:predicted transcriptional regulator